MATPDTDKDDYTFSVYTGIKNVPDINGVVGTKVAVTTGMKAGHNTATMAANAVTYCDSGVKKSVAGSLSGSKRTSTSAEASIPNGTAFEVELTVAKKADPTVAGVQWSGKDIDGSATYTDEVSTVDSGNRKIEFTVADVPAHATEVEVTFTLTNTVGKDGTYKTTTTDGSVDTDFVAGLGANAVKAKAFDTKVLVNITDVKPTKVSLAIEGNDDAEFAGGEDEFAVGTGKTIPNATIDTLPDNVEKVKVKYTITGVDGVKGSDELTATTNAVTLDADDTFAVTGESAVTVTIVEVIYTLYNKTGVKFTLSKTTIDGSTYAAPTDGGASIKLVKNDDGDYVNEEEVVLTAADVSATNATAGNVKCRVYLGGAATGLWSLARLFRASSTT